MSHLKAFTEFVGAKPADEMYGIFAGNNCAIAQYAKTIDPKFFGAGMAYWLSTTDSKKFTTTFIDKRYSRQIEIAIGAVAEVDFRTFGELHKKLLEIVE